MKIVVSVPVHEKPDVILDQINNIKKYIEKPIIVLHVSKSFFGQYSLERLNNIPDVYINPENLDTVWGDILLPHVSNYFYMREIELFDYFLFQASNDMFVRRGIEDYVGQYEAGFCRRVILQKESMWWPAQAAWEDRQLRKIMNVIGQRQIVATQIEGTFLRRDIAEKVMSIIKNNYTPDDKEEIYTREENYFSTIASAFVDWGKVGYPTTYSEVHIFDRCLWKLRTITRTLYYKCGIHLLIRDRIYFSFEARYNDRLFKSHFNRITKKAVEAVRDNNQKYIMRNSTLNDYPGYFQLYDVENVYAVKRIARDYGDKVRTYIRNF